MLKTFLGYIPSYGLQSSALNRSPQHGKQLTSSFSQFFYLVATVRQKKIQAVECHWMHTLMDHLDWSERNIDIRASAKLKRTVHAKFEKTARQPVALDGAIHRTLWKLAPFGTHWQCQFILFKKRVHAKHGPVFGRPPNCSQIYVSPLAPIGFGWRAHQQRANFSHCKKHVILFETFFGCHNEWN